MDDSKKYYQAEHMPTTLLVSGFSGEGGLSKFEAFDEEQFTKRETDHEYRLVKDKVGVALSLLLEAGFNVDIEITKKED